MSKSNQVEIYYNEQISSKESKRMKWFVLFAYSFLAFSNVLGFVSYSPVWLNAAIYYDVEANDLYWIGNLYYITFFVFGPPFIPLLEKRLDLCLQVSSILTAAGAWMVWFGKQSFFMCLVGYFFVGVSEALFLAVPVYLSEIWFTAYDRTLATCLGSYATLAGIMASYTYSSFQFWDLIDQEIINIKIEEMNFIIAILNTICVPFCFIFIRNTNQIARNVEENLGFFKQFFEIFRIEEFLLDLLAFAMFIGISWVYISVISLQLYPFGYTQLEVGIAGIFFTGSGIIAGIWISFKLDLQTRQGKLPDYDIIIKYTTSMGFLALLLLAFLISYLPFWVLIILNIMNGIGLNVIYPIAIEAFVEKLYPLKSLIVSTWILGIANILGFALNYILVLPTIIDYGIWLSLLILTPFQLYFLLFYKSKFRRFELSN
ncbi:unnamed protein product [Paramecium sonneborni]|uniref:Major facilitator superfamily (MFS) profile domain-containing protein n=1 Tax=Paramecium sonneborni TaxID=65129 RepID=A0A8S1QS97_9CILI|nr:unnamed protein product [Paramecium sonneborni]